MKKILYSLAILMVLLITQSSFAQLPSSLKVSDGSNEYWYYIQNGADPTAVKSGTTYIPSEGLDKAGLLITSRGGNGSNQVYGYVYHLVKNNDLQLWKLVSNGSGAYYLINKKTGNKLALGTGATTCLGTDAANCSDLFYTNTDGNASYEVKLIGDKSDYVTIKRVGSTNKLVALTGNDKKFSVFEAAVDEYSAPVNEAVMKSEKAWVFISENDMKARPFPQLSTSDTPNWNTFELVCSTASVNGMALTVKENAGTIIFSRAKKDITKDEQLWKIIPVEGENAQVYIANKLIANRYLTYSGKDFIFLSEPKPFVIKNVRGDEMGIMPVEEASNSGGINGFVSLSTGGTNNPLAIATTITNYAGTGKFVPAVSTSVDKVSKNDSFSVSVENGYIKVWGTDAPFKVYTINGQEVNGKSQLVKGIYIVKVGSTSKKVVVY